MFPFIFSRPASGDAVAMRRIEAKLDAIMAHLGIESPAAPFEECVRSIARSGRKIEAIKVYREHTGAGLRDAKQAVEAMARG